MGSVSRDISCGIASTSGRLRIPTSGFLTSAIKRVCSGAGHLVSIVSIRNSVRGANKTDKVDAIIKLLLLLRSAINY